MNTWTIVYELEDGTQGKYNVEAINRIMAFEVFEGIAKENGWKVVAADAQKGELESISWVLHSKRDLNPEVVDYYNDFDSVRADFKYITEEHRDEFNYVDLVQVKVYNDNGHKTEIREIIDQWKREWEGDDADR